MQLISLNANSPQFHPIKFNETGISLIVGKQKNPNRKANGRTYNGVGKSLALALSHFCLGSSKNNGLEQALSGWEFVLQLEIDGERHSITRATSKQDVIILDGIALKLREFREQMEGPAFPLATAIPGLSFRSLLPAFARQNRESYASFNTFSREEPPYDRLLRVAYLLGLDTGLVAEKHRLKADRERIKALRGNLNKDQIFIEFFTDNKNIEIELKDLEEQTAKLEADLTQFQVAEDYNDIERSADEAKRELQVLRNQASSLRESISNINASLQVRPDVSLATVVDVYQEANLRIPELVVKSIEEVTTFHEQLVRDRARRLTREKSRIEDALKQLDEQISAGSGRLDDLLRFLGTHHALEELVSTTNYLAEIKAKAQKIKDYKSLLERYSVEEQNVNIQLSNETIKTNTYLSEANDIIDSNLNCFRSLARRFYPDRPGGLTVRNNEGDNQIRFDVDAKIQDDASDGINEVKIFCFDMTVLLQRHHHAMNFLWHDSRLFSDMDPRQRAVLFKVAHERTLGKHQYIATMNEDQIQAMKDQFTDEEFKSVITDNIILELNDESPSDKLLGIEVDMDY